jgi:hypothetical protein
LNGFRLYYHLFYPPSGSTTVEGGNPHKPTNLAIRFLFRHKTVEKMLKWVGKTAQTLEQTIPKAIMAQLTHHSPGGPRFLLMGKLFQIF